MNHDGIGFAYRDQAAAEEAANIYRLKNVALLRDLERLNESIDSVKLAAAIADGWEALK